jgi:vacuolar protein-sorting-associated protein 4
LQTQIDALITRADVTWTDIGGLAETKRAIQLAFGIAVAQKLDGLRLDSIQNVLLYGPPGTGKTLLARAVAGEIKAAFFTAKPSDLMSKWVGESEQNIARLFDEARRHERAIIFPDEVLGRRTI